jgi:hypothetical protein
MLDADAAMLNEELKRAKSRLDGVTKRIEVLEVALRTLQQTSQRQGQAIRSAKPPSRD